MNQIFNNLLYYQIFENLINYQLNNFSILTKLIADTVCFISAVTKASGGVYE